MTAIEPNQVVWVLVGGVHEEPATVVALGCTFTDESDRLRFDGIMVSLHVSMMKIIYAPEQVRPLLEKRMTRAERQQTTTAPMSATKAAWTKRSVVTPSPSTAATVDLSSSDSKKSVPNRSTQETKKPQAKRKSSPAATSGAAKKQPAASADSSTSSDEGDKPATKRKMDDTKKTVIKRKSPSAKEAPVAKKPAAKKPKLIVAAASDSDESESSSSGDEDDRPFIVEYAPTSRSTCRRCDSTILKGCLRISHVPSFRGKPGFRVYRHLTCALFSEDIDNVEQIGGYRKLSRDDLEALALRIEESKMELDQENEEIMPDELVPVVFEGETRGPPPGLAASLLPFQTEGVSWMYHQEVHVPDIRGGILADEMGMGKTVQTITTILDNRPKLQHTRPGTKHPPSAPDLEARQKEDKLWANSVQEWEHEMAMNNIPKKMWPKKLAAARAGTLVVCPVIWKSEIEKFTDGESLSVGIYHGPNRASEMPRDMMQKYDVVLTTYQVLEQDFRKMVSPNKVACPNCGGKFKIDKLRVHLKYFCGEGAQRTEAQARQRRSGERPGGRGSGGGKRPFSSSKKPPMTKVADKSAAPAKKTIKVKRTSGYDSDSELSVESIDDNMVNAKRPSRSAAVKASKKVTATVKDYDDDGDDSSFGSDEDSSSSSDESTSTSEDERVKIRKNRQGPPQTSSKHGATQQAAAALEVAKGGKKSTLHGKRRKCPSSLSSSSSDESTNASEDEVLADVNVIKKRKGHRQSSTKKGATKESADDEGVQRALAKQRLALEAAKAGEKSALNGKRSKSMPLKGMPKGAGKHKKFEGSSSDSSDSVSGLGIDPMKGIDMEELVSEAMAGSRFSILHTFAWWRVVLDEAHFIKSRSSQTAAAAFSLSSIHRWCLSGTPLQNRVGELYSLIRFLRIDPMAYYSCRQKGCKCKSIHYRMKEGKCQDCGHRPFSHYAHFNKHVLNPIQRDGYSGDGRRAMFKLKTDVLDKCLLRRTKETRAEDMNLPPRIVTIRSVRLHPVEEDFYNALYTQTKSSFDDYVAEGTLLNNYAHIFDLLTKMRQAVDHPYLIVYSKKNAAKARGSHRGPAVANGSVDCEMCHEPPSEDRVLSSCCGAGFCRGCVIEYLTGAGGGSTPCPSCNAPFTIDLNQASAEVAADDSTLAVPVTDKFSTDAANSFLPSLKELPHVATGSILRRINLAEFATSTKIEVLIQELIDMRQKRPGSKALVFSQFVNMLDLVRWRIHSDPCLNDLGLGVRILHGGMDVKSRDAALKDFREDPNCRVLLMSLKAAGVALNLTVASECFLLDLWWNPSAEMQAIDRTHRLGQYRPIRAVRFVAEGTVEERVLQLQEKKRLVFDGTIGRDAGSLKMLTVADMVSLFQ